MTTPRSTRAHRRTRRSGRIRAGLAMAGVAAVGTGLGVQGTMAYFTDSATATTGSIVAGTLDITLNGALAGSANNGGTMTLALAATNLLPGESVAYSFPVKNNGSTPLTYTLAATGAGGLAVTGGLQYSIVFAGANATNTGTEAAGNRVGSCGVTVTDANTTVLTSTPSPLGSGTRSLASGVTENACIVARLNSAAPNTLQGLTGTASFVFSAKQVGA